MADSFDQFETLLRESIEPGVIDLQLEDDDIMWSLMDTFPAIETAGRRADGAAGYECSWKVKVQDAGLVTGGKFTGNSLQMMGYGSDQPMAQAADALYPDPAQAPLRNYLTIRMYLRRILGVLAVNEQQLLADLATEPIEEVSGNLAMDAVRQVRKAITGQAWGDGTAVLAQFTAAGTVYEAGASVTGLTVKEGTVFRLKEGQRYDLATYGATVHGPKLGTARCVQLDEDNRTAFFQAESGTGNITVADGTVIIQNGMYDFSQSTHAAASLAGNGIAALLLATGTFPGTSYNVAYYPRLKSFVSGSTTADTYPTPEIIAKQIDKITDAGWTMPEVLIAEQSLWTLYAQMERQANATYQVPMGGTYVANGGVDGPMFSHQNKTFARLSSSQCRPNTVYGITPSTFKRFMPLGNKNIRWKFGQGGLSGAPSIFGAVTSGRQVTELAQAPFHTFWQMGVQNPKRNFILKGLYNQRDVAS